MPELTDLTTDPNDRRTYFKPNLYMARLLKYSSNAYYIDLLDRKGNLRQTLQNARIELSKRTVDDIFSENDAWISGATQQQKEDSIKSLMERMAEQDKKNAAEFFKIHCNQTLVMLCTVFDTFLTDCFSVITFTKPSTLKSFNVNIELSKDTIANREVYTKAITPSHSKLVKKFDWSGISDKFVMLERLKVDDKVLFDLKPKQILRFPEPKKLLLDIYGTRHDIEHRNLLKIESHDQINEITEFLTHLCIWWGGVKLKDHFFIHSDLGLMHEGKSVTPEDV